MFFHLMCHFRNVFHCESCLKENGCVYDSYTCLGIVKIIESNLIFKYDDITGLTKLHLNDLV